MKTKIFTLSLLAFIAGVMPALAASFVGFEATSANKLGNQIANENLIQNMVNVTLEETSTQKYSIKVIELETGSFTMGGVQFLFTPSEAGQTAYKTYDGYIQPNGVNREIRIPAMKGENVRISLVEAFEGLVIDGDTMDLQAGDNFVTAKNNTMVITNPVNKPKFAAIRPEVVEPVHFWRFDEGEFAQLDDTLRSPVTIDGLTMNGAADDYYMVFMNTSATIGGEKFKRCLKTHGTGKKDHYSLYFDVEGPSIIEIFLRSQSTEVDRTLILECDSFGSGRTKAITASHNGPSKRTVAYKLGPTRIYLYGETGGIALYGIRVTLGGSSNEIVWMLDKNKQLLTLDGDSVEMADFDASSSTAPWHFYRSYIKRAKLSEGIFTIGNYAFNDLPLLENVNIPTSVKEVGKFAFANTPVYNDVHNWYNNSLYLDNWLITSSEGIAGAYGLRENTIGIANDAFYHRQQLTSVELPESLLYLGDYCFADCPLISTLELPKNVIKLGNKAFMGCVALTSLTSWAVEPPTAHKNAFLDVDQSACTLYVPEESVEAYKTADVWKDFGSIKSIDAPEEHEAVENTSVLPAASTSKLLRNGQILILRGDRTYTLTGQLAE